MGHPPSSAVQGGLSAAAGGIPPSVQVIDVQHCDDTVLSAEDLQRLAGGGGGGGSLALKQRDAGSAAVVAAPDQGVCLRCAVLGRALTFAVMRRHLPSPVSRTAGNDGAPITAYVDFHLTIPRVP